MAVRSAGHPNPVDSYKEMIAGVDLARLNDTERKALFLNAYNVFAMSKLVDNTCGGKLCDRCVVLAAPWRALVDSPRRRSIARSIHDIGNFVCPVWYQKAGVVGGEWFSLDNIEDDYLTTHFHDARVHGGACAPFHAAPRTAHRASVQCSGEPLTAFLRHLAGMNCASLSCPNLRREAYESQTLNQQLDDQVTRAVVGGCSGWWSTEISPSSVSDGEMAVGAQARLPLGFTNQEPLVE